MLEAWYMPDVVSDPCAENRTTPPEPVSRAELADDLGVLTWEFPSAGFSYPAKAVPWDPENIPDAGLMAVRKQRGYNYADILTISEFMLPGYHEKVKAFFEEHLHTDEEVRYIIAGSGYFDVRGKNDRWVRIRCPAGSLLVLPEGIYHRFTVDKSNYIHAMRLFKGVPVWTPINRPADENPARARYLAHFSSCEQERVLRENIVGCMRSFYQLGWCLGSSGAMACRVGDGPHAPVLMTPSGVPKESLSPSDLYLLSTSHEHLKIPMKAGKPKQGAKISDSAPLCMEIFAARPDVKSICHIHSAAAVLEAGATRGSTKYKVANLEMIKGLGLKGSDVLEVPIVPNKPTEPELIPDVLQALRASPAAQAVLVEDHGAYIFGATAEKAKIATECLGFVLDVKYKKRLLGDRSRECAKEEEESVAENLELPAAKRARRSAGGAARSSGPAVMLLDIEGTTTPISFVKDKLFPYSAAAVGPWLAKACATEVAAVVDAFRLQCKADGVQDTISVPDVERLTKEWIAKDRKVPALKELQGRLWKSGYASGELLGEMFVDSPQAMAKWVDMGRRVAIFSSGSREAQRLIFSYSDKGDLSPFISAYFDPKSAMASKQEAKAYQEIALSLGIDPSQGLFLTDIPAEAAAAKEAGWAAMVVVRPGNAPLPAGHGFQTVTSLMDV
mmetsp:Transcript_64530/g.154129  ORF Transcript_64530/g.154129 Transcript_64530/m.154129 type:complete len:673 (-) Transcript_64530:171-2189(-)